MSYFLAEAVFLGLGGREAGGDAVGDGQGLVGVVLAEGASPWGGETPRVADSPAAGAGVSLSPSRAAVTYPGQNQSPHDTDAPSESYQGEGERVEVSLRSYPVDGIC